MVNIKNPNGFRRCYLCNTFYPTTLEYFPKDKNRPLGIGYQCRTCAKIETKKRSKPRPNRWKNMTDEQKLNKLEWSRNYINSRCISHRRIAAYKAMDKNKNLENDLTVEWYQQNILNKSCIYCGDIHNIGCDRKNNNKGHTKENVVPCCHICNTSRMHLYSFEEMLILGKAIAEIKLKRRIQLQNASGPS